MKSKILLTLTALSLFTGCGSEKEIDKIGDAQICLNKASGPTQSLLKEQVNSCLMKVDGLTSKSSQAVRCNGSFIKEGFASPSKYIAALETLKNTAGGTANFMGLITFTSEGEYVADTANAQATFNYCLDSGAKGTTLLSAFGYFAMGMYKYMHNGGSCPSTPNPNTGYDLTTCMKGFFTLGNAAAIVVMFDITTTDASAVDFQSSLGSVLAATYNLSCNDSSANADLCGKLSTAVTKAGGVENTRALTKWFLLGIACETNDTSITDPINTAIPGACS